MISVFKLKIYRKLSLTCNCDMNLSGFCFHILRFFITICKFSLGGHLLPDALSWWLRWLGGRRLSVDVSPEGDVLRLSSLARHLFFPKHLGFSDTDEVKNRNAHLLH